MQSIFMSYVSGGDLLISPNKDILWHLSVWIKFHVYTRLFFIQVRMQQLTSVIYDAWFSCIHLKRATVIYHTVSNLQGQWKKWLRTTAWQRMNRRASLPWRHLRQFMRGSLRGGASQIQQTSSTPAATEANRKTQRGRGGEEVNVKEEDRERAVNSINLCILIHILATSLISVSPAPF